MRATATIDRHPAGSLARSGRPTAAGLQHPCSCSGSVLPLSPQIDPPAVDPCATSVSDYKRGMSAIRRHVAMLHEDGEIPLVLGGDHSAILGAKRVRELAVLIDRSCLSKT